ncbi:hypothetical protein PVAND_014244 [Polypedilum vanderplanki]|uniref:Uncharacterized protein n=1 Tax=Polypedilum vanderplanki TaxID=319348 RepID=A0A9J6CRR7_POLVA|nr:hypothetical protein PVAND_014244 [Polypedilum vanderplanki]
MEPMRKSSVRFSQASQSQKPSEESIQKPIDIYNDRLYNKNGTRNLNIPYDLFVERKQKALREKEKKRRQEKTRVSAITEKDQEIFEEAFEKLQDQKKAACIEKRKQLWILELARSKKLFRPETKAAGDAPDTNPCPMTYETSIPRAMKTKKNFNDVPTSDVEDEFKMDFEKIVARKKFSKQGKLKNSNSKNKIKEEKSKKPKVSNSKSKTFVKIPPLKTKPWKPPQKAISKIVKVVKDDGKIEFIRPVKVKKVPRFPPIVYPKLKTRKWEPPKSDVKIPEKKIVKIDYPPLKMRKTPWKPIDKKPMKKAKYQVEKLSYSVPHSTLPKMWYHFRSISSKMQILHGKTSQYSKKFSFVSNGKQSIFIASAALSTQELMPTRAWNSFYLDEIILYGDKNFRSQLNRFKNQKCIKPSDINSKFLLKNARVIIEIGKNVERGVFDRQNSKEIFDRVEEMFLKFSEIIFVYNNQAYAIWRDNNGIFIFNSEDTDKDGKVVSKNQGACCVIRSYSLRIIIDYLLSNLRVFNQIYEIYSFHIESTLKMGDVLNKTMSTKVGDNKILKEPEDETLIEIQDFDEQTIANVEEKKQDKIGISTILFHHQAEQTLGDHFQNSSLQNHCYLTCEICLNKTEKNEAPFVSSVAIIMLKICRSSLWTSSTIGKIFQIGHSLYYENVESVLMKQEIEQNKREKLLKSIEAEEIKNESNEQLTIEEIRQKRKQKRKQIQMKEIQSKKEISITEIQPIVIIGKLKLVLSVESFIVGKIMSRNSSELSLQAGVDNLFKHYDYGLIFAYDFVAIWREQNNFFMFDPNQCDQFRRSRSDEGNFNSCLNCFKNTTDLVKLFIENLPKENRYTIFKIFKIETFDYVEKPNDWYNFKGIGESKWILSGHICEVSDEFSVNNRNNQSTCIALTALAKTHELGIMSWNSNIVDEIVRIGDEFYSGCVLKLKEQGKFLNANLNLSETLKELQLQRIVVDFSCEDGVFNGNLDETSLYHALKDFFANDDLAVVSIPGISLAVFKWQDAFYLFDSQPRSEMGKNFKTLDPINYCKMNGTACVIRFICLCKLAMHIMSNAELVDFSTFSIGKVEIFVRNSTNPCYFNYTPCTDAKYCAMLRSANNYHEDSEHFKCDAVEKTLCNLLSCLCFTRVLDPRNWASNDLNEIIKIGLKFFCKTADKFDEMWKIFSMIEICSVKLKIERKDEKRGIFVAKESILPEKSKEILEDEMKFSEIEQKVDENKKEAENEKNNENPQETNLTEKRSSLFPQKKIELTLIEVLKSLDEKDEALAILSSSLFNVAIFKLNKFYYVFDPKESNGRGMLTRKRLEDFINKSLINERDEFLRNLYENDERKRISQEEEFQELIFGRPVVFGAPNVKPSHMFIANFHQNADDDEEKPVKISQMGSAYIMWFTTLELFYNHLINKIPGKFRNESFTLTYFDIIPELSNSNVNEKWHNFEMINKNHWILRGTFSQNDSSHFVYQNVQDSANCVIALIFSQLCNNDEWNSTIVDIILNFGDRLHRKSARNHECDCKLSIEDLKQPIFIRPYVIEISEEIIKQDFVVKKNDKIPLESLKEVLRNFMQQNSLAVLIAKNYSVAIWKNPDNESLMMFDPHDIGPDGCKKSTGVACIQRFLNHSDLINIFINNVKDIDMINEYQLINIKITINECKDEQNECLENSLYIHQKVTTIRGKSIEPKSSENVSISICHAIAMICVSRSLEPEYYTPDIIDRIIMLGNELARECKINQEICFKDFDLKQRFACSDEILWNFQLNETFTSVQMDIFQRGLISKNVCPLPNLTFALEEFFNFHQGGLLVTTDFIIAIWKENCKFFVFYSCKIDENGRVAKCGQPGVVWFKSLQEVYSNISSNLRKKEGIFELRICDVKMTDEMKNATENECTEKKSLQKFIREEIIAPAVAHISEIKLNKSKEVVKENENEDIEDMIIKLKRRNGKTFGFMQFSRGGFLCGQISKCSKTFDEISRKYHSPAICLVALAMNEIKSMNCWNGELIDSVICSGNAVYINSMTISGVVIKKDITKLVNLIFIGNREVELKAESCFEFAHEGLSVPQLKYIFDQLLSCYDACYMLKSLDCWAIVKSDGFYYLFDPLGIKVPLKKVKQHRATLYRFDCLSALLEQFLKIISKLTNKENIEIGGILIKLKPSKQKEKKIPKKVKKSKCPEIVKKASFMIVPDLPLEKCENETEIYCEYPLFECP